MTNDNTKAAAPAVGAAALPAAVWAACLLVEGQTLANGEAVIHKKPLPGQYSAPSAAMAAAQAAMARYPHAIGISAKRLQCDLNVLQEGTL